MSLVIPPVLELSLVGIADAGIPNRERIVLRPAESINLAQCGIFLCQRGNDGVITPLVDHFFWFTEVVATPPSWIMVYTGKGEPTQSQLPESGQTVYSLHWGKDYTLFNIPGVAPVIFRIGGILVPNYLPMDAPPVSAP